MATKNVDFIAYAKAKTTTGNGYFIGFRTHLFFMPDRVLEHGASRMTETTFSYKGKTISETVENMINDATLSVADFVQNLQAIFPDDNTVCCPLDAYKYFKISNGWFAFARSITVLKQGTLMPWNVLITDKNFLNEAKAFYKEMLK